MYCLLFLVEQDEEEELAMAVEAVQAVVELLELRFEVLEAHQHQLEQPWMVVKAQSKVVVQDRSRIGMDWQ